jgi:hypothetical protein
MAGDWPELKAHQWAILNGQTGLFMSWNMVAITREEFEEAKRKQGNGILQL